MVQIRDLINTSILNSEWVGFNGDSEYIDEDGELQMGSWTFLEVSSKQEAHYGLDAEVGNDKIFNSPWTFWVQNDNGTSCKVQLNYMHSQCKVCGQVYKSYHCLDCHYYYGDEEELEPFCRYCTHTLGSENCNNCVWNGE